MSIKAVLFDLDGTLLPMDQDIFIKAYFGGLVTALAPHGYDPKELASTIWAGTSAMVKNDGTKTNEGRFWEVFATVYGARAKLDEPYFDAFYESPEGFDKVKAVLGYTPKAKEAVELVRALGLRCVLATNPVFPAVATRKRISWAGLAPEDFELYTTYENSRFCKPNIAYYEEILEKTGLAAEECLMVGNDVTEDMVAQKLGFKVFLLPACIINMENKDISCYPQGDFIDLLEYIKQLVAENN